MSEEENDVTPPVRPVIRFTLEPGEEPTVQLGPGNEIRVRGKLITEDAEVVEGFREFLRYWRAKTAVTNHG